uniref:Cuticle protein n=1 Tax=Musca domestica TaxID=7370 RepID=A0A1I8NJ54_MUSDO
MKIIILTVAVLISATRSYAAGGGPYLPPISKNETNEKTTVEITINSLAPAAHYTAPATHEVPPVPVPIIVNNPSASSYSQSARFPDQSNSNSAPAFFAVIPGPPYGPITAIAATQFVAPGLGNNGQGGYAPAGFVQTYQNPAISPLGQTQGIGYARTLQQVGGQGRYISAAVAAPQYQYLAASPVRNNQAGYVAPSQVLSAASIPTYQFVTPGALYVNPAAYGAASTQYSGAFPQGSYVQPVVAAGYAGYNQLSNVVNTGATQGAQILLSPNIQPDVYQSNANQPS